MCVPYQDRRVDWWQLENLGRDEASALNFGQTRGRRLRVDDALLHVHFHDRRREAWLHLDIPNPVAHLVFDTNILPLGVGAAALVEAAGGSRTTGLLTGLGVAMLESFRRHRYPASHWRLCPTDADGTVRAQWVEPKRLVA